MPVSINQFKSNLQQGVLVPNRFEVTVTPGSKVYSSLNSAVFNRVSGSNIRFFINGVNHPGISALTTDTMRYGYGTPQKMPYGVRYTDLTASVLIDNDGKILNMFRTWMKMVVNYDIPENKTINDYTGVNIDHNPYEVAYHDEYTTNLRISVYDTSDFIVSEINFVEAYPISIGDIGLNWNASSQALLPVTFAYKYWYGSGNSQLPVNKSTRVISENRVQPQPSSDTIPYPGYNKLISPIQGTPIPPP